MADTQILTVTGTAWTEIAAAGTSGHVSVDTSSGLYYRQATAQPSANDASGHVLIAGGSMSFTLESGRSLWGRGTLDRTVGVAVSTGLTV